MNYDRRDAGYIGAQFLFVLIFLSAMAGGAAMLVSGLMRSQKASRDYTSRLEAYDRISGQILADLRSDPSPEADTGDDPVWKWKDTELEGYKVTLRSLSGSLNVNFVRKALLETTSLQTLLINGKSPDDLQKYRFDEGPFLSASAYTEYFNAEDFDTKLTCYGWVNVNLVDEFALEKYVEGLTGTKSTGEALHQKLLRAMGEQILYTNETVKTLLGADYQALYPYLNAEPLLNVNFADPGLIRAIVAFPPYGVASPDSRAKTLIDLRESGIATKEKIAATLGIDATSPLNYWFGCQTWFWRVDISDGKNAYYCVICRFPDDSTEPGKAPVYTVMEQGFGK